MEYDHANPLCGGQKFQSDTEIAGIGAPYDGLMAYEARKQGPVS
jgi:hypothetical protein